MPDPITDAEIVASLRTIAGELHMRMIVLSQADLMRLALAVASRAKQRDAAFEAVERRMEGEGYVLPLGSLAEHRRSLTEEAQRLLGEAQAVEARYKHGIGHADWEG